MLRVIIVGAEPELAAKLDAVFNETGRFALIRALQEFPEEHELERVLRAHSPQTVFLCVDDLPRALESHAQIVNTVRGVPLIAFGRTVDQKVLMELMKVGVRDFLPLPFRPNDLLELADRTEDRLASNPLAVEATDLMFSFLPAKPGVGASTLALNLSIALTRTGQTRVLLNDFDLNSGLISFMLKLNPTYSVTDAVIRCDDLDEQLWPELISSVRGLDVLPNGVSAPGTRIQPAHIHRMLSFARRQYDVICADLSGNMEKYAIEVMMESKRIFLVTTGEIPPLHLARQRMNLLRDLDIGDRVNVLLNRWGKRNAISINQIEDLLDAPVFESFPNDYGGVHKSLVAGTPVEPHSELGKRFTGLARRILNVNERPEEKKKKSFLQSISIMPAGLR
jgi:pilus assembly protein CpaE